MILLGIVGTPDFQSLLPIRRLSGGQRAWDRHFNREHGIGQSIHDSAIHRGDAALGQARHCDARGDGQVC